MSFDEVLGQPVAVQILKHALRSKKVHHAYRFEGPDGVGKERAALALAQSLVCDAPGDGALACGACSACHRAITFTDQEPHVPHHPDVVLIARGLYSKVLGKPETNGIGVEQIRQVVLNRMGYSPHEGRALVFIIRAAHEISVRAANALLKTLEEPPASMYFVLLTDTPGAMLDTVRSRTLAVRFGPLPDAVVAQILQAQGCDPAVAGHASGSAARALELSNVEVTERRAEFIENVRCALTAPDFGSAISGFDLRNKDRHELRQELGFLAHSFAERARATARTNLASAEKAARRFTLVHDSMRALEANGSPALTIESLISRLRRA